MTTDTRADQLIDVQALRIGMFVRLDGGWMAHPFPLSNFKISTPDQLATLRALGVTQVRWDPRLSDIEPAGAAPSGTPPSAPFATPSVAPPSTAGTQAALPVKTAAANPAAEAAAVASKPRPSLEELLGVDPSVAPAGEAELLAQRLGRQRAALVHCERQFNEAASAYKQATSVISSDPQDAKVQLEALSNNLLDKMLVEPVLCIRLLRDTAGGKAATHTLNVSILSMLLGRNFGLSDTDLLDLGVGALLHDIGKIDLPERLHYPDERFTPTELKAYQEHVVLGLARGQKMGLRASVMQVIAQHHEMADGSGFPLKLGSERMSDAARIVAMVNAYDTLCNPQLSTRAITPHEALATMFTHAKKRYDPALLRTFIKMMGVYPAGSTVQLTDDRYAVVVSVDSARPLKPRVLVHDARVAREAALIVDLGDQPGLGIRRGVKPEQLPLPTLHYLAPRQRVVYYFEPAYPADPA